MPHQNIFKGALLSSALFSFAGCASNPDVGPVENYNRAMFDINESVDKAVLGPVAKTYGRVIPAPVRKSSSNFFSNLGEPVNFANKLLQGDVNGAADVTGRFLMNSTIGVLGLFDVASKDGIPKHSEDFGQTLAVWGVPSGSYIVLPIVGPSNLRDILAKPVDTVFSPVNYADPGTAYFATAGTLGALNGRLSADSALEGVRQQLDPYSAIKRGYQIFRESQIQNGKRSEDAYDDLPDADSYDDF